jgi:hypothetical protein
MHRLDAYTLIGNFPVSPSTASLQADLFTFRNLLHAYTCNDSIQFGLFRPHIFDPYNITDATLKSKVAKQVLYGKHDIC